MTAIAMAVPRKRAGRRFDLGRALLVLYTVLFLAFLVVPILLVVVVSFAPTPFVTFPMRGGLSLQWYERVFEYRPFLDSLWLSVKLAVVSSVVGALFALPAALALARSPGRLSGAVVAFLLSPISIPGIVVGFSMLYFFSAMLIRPGFTALLIAHSIVAIPYVLRTALGVYRTMPPHAEEAAIILGASRLQVLYHVTLPQLRPAIFAGMLFSFLISLDNLPISFFFGTASSSALPVVMMSYLQNQFDPSVAAIATIQMVLAIVALLVADRIYGIGKLNSG